MTQISGPRGAGRVPLVFDDRGGGRLIGNTRFCMTQISGPRGAGRVPLVFNDRGGDSRPPISRKNSLW